MDEPSSALGRVVGIDPGDRWVGVALSDSQRSLALPVGTFDLQAESDAGLARIREWLGDDEPTLLVVGVPLLPDGGEDQQAAAFRRFGEDLAAKLGVACEPQNERFSTRDPHLEGGARRPGARSAKRQQRDRRQAHANAAAAILQRWLDHAAGERARAAL